MAEEDVLEPARKPDEDDRTLSWVEEQFRHLGFNDWQAASLADAGCDWHDAKRLIDRGCSYELAIDVLL